LRSKSNEELALKANGTAAFEKGRNPKWATVVQFAKSLTTEAKKAYLRKHPRPNALVILRVLGGSGFCGLHRETAP
jgi:hypothetical protein